jgi:hypothetical protein
MNLTWFKDFSVFTGRSYEGGRGEVARQDSGSGESVESIGDLPIELPHLEGDLGVDHQMLW